MMVDRLADRWGVELDDGTEVWFEFQRPSGKPATAVRRAYCRGSRRCGAAGRLSADGV